MHFTRHLFPIFVLFIYLPNLYNGQKAKPKQVFGCSGKLLISNSTGARSARHINHNEETLSKVPERFDSREKWPHCKSLHMIHQQGSCGGCWAFSTASVMSDRLCIATNGKFNKMVSIQDVLECCRGCAASGGGCKAGYIFNAIHQWDKAGFVTGNDDGCKPLEKGVVKGILSECRSDCTNPKYKTPYSEDKSYGMTAKMSQRKAIKIKHIQAEIMVNGPVAAAADTYRSWSDAEPETILFRDPTKKDEFGEQHAIKIIGWDVIDGTPVWIIANSWGKDWCNKGFCYIRRGKNDFRMETGSIVASIPNVAKNEKAKGGMRSGSSKIRCCGNLMFFLIFLNILIRIL